MGLTPLALLSVISLATHNNSEGTSRFVIEEQGRIDVQIQLLELDLPELCDVDFAGPEGRAVYDEQVTQCVQRGLPSWLRVHVETAACTIGDVGWHHGEGLQILLTGVAKCERPVGRKLTIDWGLFAGTELEHVNSATIVFPDASRHEAMFSRKHNKVVVDVEDPRSTRAGVALAIVILASVITGIVVAMQRRRRPRRG